MLFDLRHCPDEGIQHRFIIYTHTHMCAFYEVFQCVYEGAFYGVFTRLSTEFVGMMGRFYRVFTRWKIFAEKESCSLEWVDSEN